MAKDEVVPDWEVEVVTDESPGGEPGSIRKIRVYADGGDYVLEIPSESTVTFGYFNPAAPRETNNRGFNDNSVARATALRIYETTAKSAQLACVLNCRGFRDLRIKKTILQQRVTIERREEYDDESWSNESSGKRELTVRSEDDVIPF